MRGDLMKYFITNNLFSDRQYRFIKFRFTVITGSIYGIRSSNWVVNWMFHILVLRRHFTRLSTEDQ
jgi:hypothetical protein